MLGCFVPPPSRPCYSTAHRRVARTARCPALPHCYCALAHACMRTTPVGMVASATVVSSHAFYSLPPHQTSVAARQARSHASSARPLLPLTPRGCTRMGWLPNIAITSVSATILRRHFPGPAILYGAQYRAAASSVLGSVTNVLCTPHYSPSPCVPMLSVDVRDSAEPSRA